MLYLISWAGSPAVLSQGSMHAAASVAEPVSHDLAAMPVAPSCSRRHNCAPLNAAPHGSP